MKDYTESKMMIHLIDNHTIKTPKTYKDSKNLINDLALSNNQGRYSLKVSIRATHSGYIVNRRVYPGIHMERAVGSWVTPADGGTAAYNKPIMINHDQEDVNKIIGRVKKAEFIKLKQGNDFLHDFKNPSTGGDLGSGYIILSANITDASSIQKIMDETYQSVSTGATTSEARCSICGSNWLDHDGDICEHMPGKKYKIGDNDYLCYIVTGPLDYREASYVAVPAQPYAKTLLASIEEKKLKDSGNIYHVTEDKEALHDSLVLFDTDNGLQLDFVLRDDQEDVLPDFVTKFKKTMIQVPNGDESMKVRTTEEADSVLDKWILGEPKSETKDQAVSTEDKALVEGEKQEVSQEPREELISKDAIKEAIDLIRSQRDSLKSEIEVLKTSLTSKDSEIVTLTKSVADAAIEKIKRLASELALMRFVQDDKQDESIESYASRLSSRSEDSLKDAIEDERPRFLDRISKIKISSKNAGIMSVSDPTLTRDAETKRQPLKSKQDFLDEE